MRKIFLLLIATLFLNGCFQVLALVGPAATGATTGNIYQSVVSYSLGYGVKKTTGKTIIENVIDINKTSKSKEKNILVNSLQPDIIIK